MLPDGKEVSYAYDSFNRLRLVDDGHWPLAYGYDEVGRLTEEYQGFASLFYGYYSTGNLTRQRLPDGNLLAYQYQQGQVSRIALNGQVLSKHQYHGERETRRITGEVVSEFDYDGQQRLRHQRATAVVQAETAGYAPDVTPVIQRRYEYDLAGNLTQILDPHKGNREYRYDKQHRLTEALHHPIAYPEALPQAQLLGKGRQSEIYYLAYITETFLIVGGRRICSAPFEPRENPRQDSKKWHTLKSASLP